MAWQANPNPQPYSERTTTTATLYQSTSRLRCKDSGPEHGPNDGVHLRAIRHGDRERSTQRGWPSLSECHDRTWKTHASPDTQASAASQAATRSDG